MANIVDPIAQTFFIDAIENPDGVFIHSIDLCFKNKDTYTYLPFTLQLRPTVNGYPHSFVVYPFAEVTLQHTEITITETPNFDSGYTRFTFSAPVFLKPGEHSMVLFTNSDAYEVYIAELGKTRIDGSERLISKQPNAGSFFKSQNGSTYTAYQNIDLMFRVNRCSFTTGTTNLIFKNELPSSNVFADLINIQTQELVLNETSTSYNYKGTSNATSTLGDYATIIVQENKQLSGQLKINKSANSFYIQTQLTTSDDKVSPVIDTERVHAIVVQNKINDGQLSSDNFTITNGGSGYTANASVTITSSYGSGANAYASVANGNVTSIIVDTAGSGYIGTVTATIAAPSVPSGNTTATVKVADEEDSSGGNCIAKYITRRVALNDGFDASTVRVYFDAVNLNETEIRVYYKVLSAEDPDTFDNRPYVLMNSVQKGNEDLVNTTKSQHNLDYVEYLHIPTGDNCAYIGNVNAVNYTDFRYFAIKIVMLSSDTTIVPKIKNLRVIALHE